MLDSEGFSKICVDNDDNVYFQNYQTIFKVDADGRVVKQIDITTLGEGKWTAVWMMSSDLQNNLFLYVQGEKRSIYKLDNNLNVITSMMIPNEYVCISDELRFSLGELAIVRFDENGTVYLHSTCDVSGVTTIREYDGDLTFQKSYTLKGYNYISYTSSDTVMAIRLEGSFLNPEINPDIKNFSSTRQTAVLLNRSFDILGSYETSELNSATQNNCKLNVFALSDNYYMAVRQIVRVISDDEYYFSEETIAMELSVFDRSGRCIGNHVFPKDFTCQFRDSKHLVGFSNTYGPVLYKIAINDLP